MTISIESLVLSTLVAFGVSTLTSMGGITGAFIILPFQISVLGFAVPGSSATNLLYNVISVPPGARRFHRERRMIWALGLLTGLSTIPGLVTGAWIRVTYLPDPHSFKLFVGCVLLALAVKMVVDIWRSRGRTGSAPQAVVDGVVLTASRLRFSFDGTAYEATVWPVVLLSAVVGIVGGIYGIGGGVILAPFLVAVYRLPIHAIAGAMLLSTWVTSLAGVLVYVVIGLWFSPNGSVVMPRWELGLALGLGGMAGIYAGARVQRYMPARIIKLLLVAGLLFISLRYLTS